MTENDYVATATAEKRLREVLDARFPEFTKDAIDALTAELLAGAEITYLPRKRTVSILLRYPETATSPKPADVSTVDGVEYQDKQSYDEAQLARVYGAGTAEGEGVPNPPKAPIPIPIPHKQARFGEFQPTVTSAPEYHEDDYFTE